jgi:hypothetical protein
MASKKSDTSDSVEMVEMNKSDHISDNGITNVNSSNDDEKYRVSVNVPGDGSCLFCAIVLAFLFPVQDDFIEFPRRLKTLFPELSDGEILDIHNLIKRYNPLDSSQNVFENSTLPNPKMVLWILSNILRTRVVEHMMENRKSFEELIQEAIQTESRWKNESIDSYFKQMVKQFFTAL